MDILILCNQNDVVAKAVYQQLANAKKDVHLIWAEELVYAPLWKHELNTKGKGTTEITLPNDTTIRSREVKAIWNRIRYFPMQHFIHEADRHYAQTELFALYFSFLKSVNTTLIHPVETYDFAMEEENIFYLKQQAIDAGLPVLDYHFTSSPRWQSSQRMIPVSLYKKMVSSFQKKAPYLIWQNQPTILTEASSDVKKVWIAGKEIIEDKGISFKTALRKLSKNVKKFFLEVHLVKTAGGYKLSTIDTFPLYAPQPVISAIANQLMQKANKAK